MNDRLQNAFLGSLVADAVSMPVHWIYDTTAMDLQYGNFRGYVAPQNPHPDSILWRSRYTARNEKGNILHDMAKYWGQRGVHYHQFLPAGDNTVNFLLSVQLYRSTVRSGRYDADSWLELYIKLMQAPGWHRDTYLEEYHRAFFDRLAAGKRPRKCSIGDFHIGGLAQVPALVAALDALDATDEATTVRSHVALTHRHHHTDEAALALTRMLGEIAEGAGLRDAIAAHSQPWAGRKHFGRLANLEDREIIGRELSSACYLPASFVGALALAWKHADDFSGGILANARCGGDNCHRGAVVGSLLAAANGIEEHWLRDLKSMERLHWDTPDPVFMG